MCPRTAKTELVTGVTDMLINTVTRARARGTSIYTDPSHPSFFIGEVAPFTEIVLDLLRLKSEAKEHASLAGP